MHFLRWAGQSAEMAGLLVIVRLVFWLALLALVVRVFLT